MIPKIHNLTQIKKQNNDEFEGIMNANKNDIIETNDQANIYDTGEYDVNSDVPVAKFINENKTDYINDDAPDNEKEKDDDDKTETDDTDEKKRLVR